MRSLPVASGILLIAHICGPASGSFAKQFGKKAILIASGIASRSSSGRPPEPQSLKLLKQSVQVASQTFLCNVLYDQNLYFLSLAHIRMSIVVDFPMHYLQCHVDVGNSLVTRFKFVYIGYIKNVRRKQKPFFYTKFGVN